MRALITGASSGIGKELARCFAADHHDLLLSGRSAERLEAVAAELRAKYGIAVDTIVMELGETGSAKRLYEAVQERKLQLAYLVNNAGFGLYSEFIEQEPAEQFEMMQLNMVTLVELTRLIVPDMIALNNGRVLNVASTASFAACPNMAVYAATKAFVLSFSEALGYELKGTGVTVTCLCPGPTATAFGDRSGFAMASQIAKRVPGAAEVAQFGYQQMFTGAPVVVHGAANRLVTASARFAPREMVTAVTAKMLKRGQENASTN